MPHEFTKFVDDQIKRHGTGQALATGIGMTLSSFLRGARKEHTLGVGKLLLLAEFVGESPSHVLRLAGKPDVADAIERLYGQARTPLSGTHRELLDRWERLPLAKRRALWTVLRGLTGDTPPTTPAIRSRRKRT